MLSQEMQEMIVCNLINCEAEQTSRTSQNVKGHFFFNYLSKLVFHFTSKVQGLRYL